MRAVESYQRPQTSSGLCVAVSEVSGRAGEVVQSSLFKAPMPPQNQNQIQNQHQHQHQPEVFGSTGGRRDLSKPADMNFGPVQSQDPAIPSSPLSGLSSPHRSPYNQMPGTPRPDYGQQMAESFTQQSAPSANPQTSGTLRPHSDPSYVINPPALRLDQYNQQSASRRPSPSHQNMDPYSSGSVPRPSERFPRSPGSQRSGDAQPNYTPRHSPDPYAQQAPAPRLQKAPEAFSLAPAESFTPQSSTSSPSPLAAAETFTPTHHQVPHQHVSVRVRPSVRLCAVGFIRSVFSYSRPQDNSNSRTHLLEPPVARPRSTL